MGFIRATAVAGMFYPADPTILAGDLGQLLKPAAAQGGPCPKAIIAPHAGYIYSGPVAASVYGRLVAARREITRVVLIGPAHRVAFNGIAVSTADAFATPLGLVPVDREMTARLLAIPGVIPLDAAHAQEHSLEVQLPFLQTLFENFTLVPLVAGGATPELAAAVLEAAWGGRETLVVVSSDLSHYLEYEQARAADSQTCAAIERLDAAILDGDQACGYVGVGGLLTIAKRRGLTVETIDLRNSGDTAGPRDRVVGYGAWAVSEAVDDTAARLTELARRAIAARLSGQAAPEPPADPRLAAHGASFVTLKKNGTLRGCIGCIAAWRPLGTDIIANAAAAAFEDPRFPPVTADELAELSVSVSVLSPPTPLQFTGEDDLLAQLRPHIDGLVIEDGAQRAVFLPAVWEMLPDPGQFLAQLKIKADLPAAWSPTLRAYRFAVTELDG